MLDEQPRHDSYKDSGVPWIGKVPSDWLWERGKWHHRHKKVLNSDGTNENVLSLTLRGVVNNDPDNPEGLVPNDYRTYQVFDKGDLVFKLIDLENVRTSRVGLVHENGIMSSAYIRVVPSRQSNSRFLYYFYYSLYQAEVFNKLGAGVRSTLNQHDLLDLPVPVINLDTQNRIVRFLDEKTAEIDAAIAKKRRLIELLNEQKAILINRAVTKGLNPDAPMKDSGVDWIGEIPAHWEVKRAKYVFDEIDERSTTGKEELLSVSHTTGVTPRSEKNIMMFMAEDYTGSKLCQPGDVVFNIMWAWMGALGVSENHGIVSPSYGVFRSKRAGRFNNWYLEHLLRSWGYVQEYNRRSTGLHSSRLRLYAQMFFAMEIGFPTKAEQDQIEAQTKDRLSLFDRSIDATQREISTLNEFKQTLIANAVTGKIKI